MAVRDTAHATLTTLLAFIIVLSALTPASGSVPDDDQTLLLAVIVNNYPTNQIGEFVLRDGTLFARRQELSSLGFRVPDSTGATTEGLVALSALHELSFRIDQPTQTLYVTAADDDLLPQSLNAAAIPDGAYKVESGTGLTLNYDLFGNSAGGGFSGSGLFDARAFSPWGVLSSGLLAYSNGYSTYASNNSVIRLDSTYVYSEPDTMRRYRAGDFISGSLPWTRPVRLGGIQVTSDFSMRPDLITFPVPALDGSVAVPSTVDVLVNGTKALSSEVQPGPFQIPQLPLINGAGTISMSITNALGQQVTTELPFYASSDLLAPGLQTYSGEAGFVRRDWGYVSDDYGSLAGALTYRRGLNQDFTIEAHGEGYPGLFMAGLGGTLNVANFAVADFSVAGSTGPSHAGLQLSAGIQRIAELVSFGASAIFASHDFADIAALNGDPVPRLQVNANVGLSLGRFGSLGLAYAGIERAHDFARDGIGTSLPASPPSPSNPFFPQLDGQSHVVYGSYSVGVGSVSLFANAFHDFANRNSDGVSVGLTAALGSRTTASASYQSQSHAQSYQAEVAQSATTVGEWGYRAFGALNDPDHAFAEATYKSPVAEVTAGVDQLGKHTTFQAEAQGAVSYVDGGVFMTNRIDDSFAVVDTNGVGGIAVQQENRYAGHTDSDGQLLVPDLRAFEINHLSIEPLDAPIDATVPYTSRDVRPYDRSGVVVMFPIKISNGALLQLTDAAGTPLPYGSVATLQSSGVKVPVGYDGEAYFVDLEAHNTVSVEMPDGRRCDGVRLPAHRGQDPYHRAIGLPRGTAMIRRIVFAALLLILAPASAHATIFCTLSASGVAFGEFSGSEVERTGSIVVHCEGHGSIDYHITLSTGSSGTYNPRKMNNGFNSLSYNLYLDPVESRLWGDGSFGTQVYFGHLFMDFVHFVTFSIPVYGQLPAQSQSVPGNYSDTITARMHYAGLHAETSFTNTANIRAGCKIVAEDMFFLAYRGQQKDTRSQIIVNCTNTTRWNVGLNPGTYPGATVRTRRMTGSRFGSSLSYDLYRNSARTLNWGQTIGSDTVAGTGTGDPQILHVFGRIPALQAPPAGGYRDSITATVTF